MCSASAELCTLCGLRKHGIVCFVLSPRAWNCNVLRKCGIVCLMWSLQVQNSVLCTVSMSVEL